MTTVTAAANTRITKAWPIPANDAAADTVYRLTAWGFGANGTTLQNLTWNIGLNGTGIRSVVVVPPGAVSQSTRWKVEILFHVVSTGAGGTADAVLDGTWSSPQAASTAQALTAGSTTAGGEAIDTTAANDLELIVGWASTTGAPSLTCLGSMFERLGP